MPVLLKTNVTRICKIHRYLKRSFRNYCKFDLVWGLMRVCGVVTVVRFCCVRACLVVWL